MSKDRPPKAEDVAPIVYNELRRVAAAYMRRERPGQTIQATALVNEAYLRLAQAGTPWTDQKHFLGIAARSMLPALDEAITRLEQVDAEQARIVELRYFAGMSVEEAADVMGISPATLKRRWALARAWLFRELSQ